MSFDSRDLRRGKDVFDAAGTYLGTVTWVVMKTDDRLPVSRRREIDVGAGSERACEPKEIRAAQRRGPGGESLTSAFSGESTGPMPTVALGNSGPRSQSPSNAYATALRPGVGAGRQPKDLIVLRLLTSLNWSTLRPRVWRIPVSLVQTVSHERIVLSVTESEIG